MQAHPGAGIESADRPHGGAGEWVEVVAIVRTTREK
jgi:hypothetical protein